MSVSPTTAAALTFVATPSEAFTASAPRDGPCQSREITVSVSLFFAEHVQILYPYKIYIF